MFEMTTLASIVVIMTTVCFQWGPHIYSGRGGGGVVHGCDESYNADGTNNKVNRYGIDRHPNTQPDTLYRVFLFAIMVFRQVDGLDWIINPTNT